VLVRLSHSHIRFGSFQRHAHSRRNDLLNQLLEFVHHNYLPEVSLDGHDDLAGAVLDEVVSRSARLTATWMMAGFVHGVLNTDNMNITGESFDYGPWRFLPTLDPSFTSAYFDFGGLYAYGRQPDAVQWNLYRLADALLPISSESSLRRSLDRFDEHLAVATREQFLERMGLSPRDPERDGQLLETALTFLRDSQIPFERIFFDWHGGSDRAKQALSSKSARFYKGDGFSLFSAALSDFEASSSANLKHPYFQDDDPCTMLIDEMEAAWEPIAKEDDWTALDTKLSDIRRMGEALALRPRPL
jgi:uncharacterized protein YdiU (UPF0061 family)